MRDAGFSLVEVLVAAFLLAACLVGIARLFAIGVASNSIARHGTTASVLAAQKMEQLRREPVLTPSGAGTLQVATSGYVDRVDQYIRRWSIERAPASGTALVVQVLVTRRTDRGAADQGAVLRAPEEARIVSVIRPAP
jgi:prepilin-type N-terminal cleavage/methylation domain-containing protein